MANKPPKKTSKINKNKVMGAVKTVQQIASSKDPGETAGKIARGALTVSHSIIGAIAGKAVERGVTAAVNKGIEVAKDPEVQAKVKKVVSDTGAAVGGAVTSAAGSVRNRVQHFIEAHRNARGEITPTQSSLKGEENGR